LPSIKRKGLIRGVETDRGRSFSGHRWEITFFIKGQRDVSSLLKSSAEKREEVIHRDDKKKAINQTTDQVSK